MRELPHPATDDIRLENVFHALSDPSRLAIVQAVLTLGGEQSCADLCDWVPKSTRSHHFKVLRESGVTRTRVSGTYRYITVRVEELDALFPGLLDLVRSRAPVPA